MNQDDSLNMPHHFMTKRICSEFSFATIYQCVFKTIVFINIMILLLQQLIRIIHHYSILSDGLLKAYMAIKLPL